MDRHIFHIERAARVDEHHPPLSHDTRRFGNVVDMPASSATGTGTGYRRHIPLTVHVRVNGTDHCANSSLLDTGASLSVLDADLLRRLGGKPQGQPMIVHGLGDSKTLGWTTMTIFIDATDPHGTQTHLESRQDFHVLPKFAPGMCLGQDFIAAHDVTISPARGRARIGRYTFEVVERIIGPYGKDVQLITSEDTVMEAGFQRWVPVRGSSLVPGVDYAVFPRLSVSPDETVRIAGPAGIMGHRALQYVLLGNYGSAPTTLSKGTIVADATAACVGDVSTATGEIFNLHPVTVEPPPSPEPVLPDLSAEDVALPLDVFDGTEPPGSSLMQDAATQMVDEVFRVGVDSAGDAPEALVALLRRHSSAFALDGRPGRVDGFDMGIDLQLDAALRPEPPRRASPEKRQAMDAAIQQLLEWDVIEPASGPISFPVLMVRQHGKWRFCVDYRQLNTVTIPDRYPLPTIDAIFQTLCGKKWFSALDAIRGYHQLGIKPGDRWKTAFVCHRGLYQYKMVPFGLRNAPAVFQRLMDHILGPLRWQQAVVYIDDSVVATDTLEEHLVALDTLLTSAERVGLKFSPSKCTFGVSSLVLLGRKVSGAGVAIWSGRADAVKDLARPTTLQELYHVLGLFGYYRAFIHRYAEIAAPLSRLLRGWRYETTDGQTRLVNVEGKASVSSRVLIPWAEEQQLSFDRLKAAIANPPVLSHPNPAHPYILYVDASKEAFAAILHQVCVEELPSSSLSSATAGRLHALGIQHLPSSVAREQWHAWLGADRVFGPILARLETGSAADDETWVLQDGVLIRKSDDRLALPEAGLPTLLRIVHDGTGHFGFTKTYLALCRGFWRPNLSVAVRAWVKHCPTCQLTKRMPKTGRLDIDNDPGSPFEAISIDLLFGLPVSRSGNNAVVAILDVFSRMVLLTPCHHDITAEGIAAVVSDRVLRMGWRPRRIISDSEARMTGAKMTALAESLNAVLAPSPPYHQQANGVERAIQTTQSVLQALSATSRAHWDRRALPATELAINSTPSVTTGFRPFDLVFIAHPSIIHAVFDSEEHLGVNSFFERLEAAAERLNDARIAIASARQEHKRQYDARRASLPALQIGDSVYIRLRDRPVAGAIQDKLDPRKLGPYRVVDVLSPHRVRLALPDGDALESVFSVEQLDLLPRQTDPFADDRESPPSAIEVPSVVDAFPPSPPSDLFPRSGEPLSTSSSSPPLPVVSPPPSPSVVAARRRLPPPALRDFQLGIVQHPAASELDNALRGPLGRPRRMVVDGREVLLVERPVAYLSRLTNPAETKQVASELELSCLAWAFAKFAHLLEGAEVTIITDHEPMDKMLTSTANITYGPAISRCRAILMPHLPNFRFQYRPGSRHVC